MPTHWTYDTVESDADLAQGDILGPTEDLRTVFKDVHPHFVDPKYIGFLVTTQSCDLVRRGTTCSTRYLNIAVIRELEGVLHDFLTRCCRPVTNQVYLHETKGDAKLLLSRIFNQNEQALGLFYLHQDLDVGITVPSVALLRVGVTLRVEHYDLLVQARRGRLKPEFTAKLGWLVGNLYSRVGTPDWSEPRERSKQLDTLIKKVLEADDREAAPLWVKQSWVDAAKDKGAELAGLSRAALKAELEKHKPPSKKEVVLDQVAQIVGKVISDATEEDLRRIRHQLSNAPLFLKALKTASE